nr:retrovirus-related Pol polyprotein from transposon 17.6 [Tanacetum cinerariifolium]
KIGYIKFSAKGTKREVFGMPIPGSLITADIREASYYQEYLENVTKHRRFLAGEARSAQDSPAPNPAKPSRKPKPTAQKDRINIHQYLIHLRMCKDFPTKMMKMFLLVENLRQQNPNNYEVYIRDVFYSKFVRLRVGRFGNLNAGSVTLFGTVISFTDAFSASSSDKTWNLTLRLKTRRIFRNLESFVGGRWVCNSLVHSSRALSALRRFGLRTASTAAKSCQGDSSKFYMITGKVELKYLSPRLEYAFLEGDDKLRVIIAKDLSVEEKIALITVLKSHKRAIAWKLSDIKVFGNSFQSCLSHLERMLKRCEDTNLCLNWEKSHFMVKEGIVIGHKISKQGIEVDKAKVDVITKLPHPTTVKVLGQRQDKHFRPIHYASKTMTEAKSNYITTEKEILAVVYAFEKFRSYLIMSKSIVYTDHSALKYLFAKKDSKVMQNFGVTHRLATPYHPQTSGQVAVSNHGLKRIIERTVGENRASWSDKLDDALWAF